MTKLHNRRHPPGLERVILKQVPRVILAGIFIPLFMAIFARLYPGSGSAAEIAKYQISVDIFSISLGFMIFLGTFTVTIGCVIVALMKGPAFVADAYKLEDADRPAPPKKPGKHLNR